MGALRIKNEVVLAKTESVYGTDAAPTASTNAILVRNASMSNEGLRMNSREQINGYLNDLQQIYGGVLRKLSFEVEMKGSGAAGTAPEIGPVLKACGLSETVVASTSVTYKPVSTSHSSATVWYYEGGRKLHKLTGCRGTCKWSVTPGGIMVAQIELIGHLASTSDASQPTPTFNTTVPKSALSMAISIGGVTAITCKGFDIDLGNQLVYPASIAASDGYGELLISSRAITGTVTVEAELQSVIDHDGDLTAGTTRAFASGTLGSTAGNRIAFSAAAMYYRDMQWADESGLRTRQLPVGFVDSSSGDDALSLVFT